MEKRMKVNPAAKILIIVLAFIFFTGGVVAAISLSPQQKKNGAQAQQTTSAAAQATAQQAEAASFDLRGAMTEYLGKQVGKDSSAYVTYINSHSGLKVDDDYPWCAVFAWSALDGFAAQNGKKNPITPCMHVSDFVLQTIPLGAQHYIVDGDYTPKPGDLFTTSALDCPDDDYRDHIGYVESVETDENGNLTKVHTIEGNFAWEINGALDTYVWRSEWVPGEHNEYGSAICEFLDLEQIFKK